MAFTPLEYPTSVPYEIYWRDNSVDGCGKAYTYRLMNEGAHNYHVYHVTEPVPSGWAKSWTLEELGNLKIYIDDHNAREGQGSFGGYRLVAPGMQVPEGL